MQRRVIVLGGGAFGTAIANLLAENLDEVTLWCHENEVARQINETHENGRFLPGIKLDSKIKATNNLDEVFSDDCIVFEAVPVKFLRNILKDVKKFVTKNQIWVVLSKGIEQKTLLLPTQIIDDVFDFETKSSCCPKKAVLAGPDFAKELAGKQFSSADLAVEDESVKKVLEQVLNTSFFKTFHTNDLIGVQVGGVVKNILTLLIGIAQGSGLGQNTKAFLLTRGFEQSVKLSEFFGGQSKTIYGLSGFGDLILTATSGLSKNLRAGILIGEGERLEELYKFFDVLPEGFNSVESIYDFIQKNNLDLPLFKSVYQIIFENKKFEILNSLKK